ncbi:MAG: CRTAC1 family protein [Candidatus Poribacteria bacterium]|nr:CRTAC1 family protein [Candidatus Poribacteria bacterium]
MSIQYHLCRCFKDSRNQSPPRTRLKTCIVLYSSLILLLGCSSLSADNHDIQFDDVTAESGIGFRHVNGAKGDYHLPETIGSGGAFFDYDTDGDLDLYLVNSGDLTGTDSDGTYTSVLYRNNGNGTFTDVTDAAGVGNSGNYGMGAACGDYDNDGDPDLYVTNFGANVLYQNNADGTFTDVTETAGVGDALWGTSATFFDYDRDSYLDLYVANYVLYSLDVPYRRCGVHGIRTHCHPKNFDGAPDRLYRNNGDGTFTDATQAAGFGGIGGPHSGKGLGVVTADFNNDGEPDVYVANDDTPNFLFYNNGDGTFTETGLLAGCAFSFDGVAQAGMGVDAGDFNGDGNLDIFVTNLSHETNALYRNNGDGTFSDIVYEANLGKESYLFVGFGTRFFDYDNDGYSDIFIANGHIIEAIAQVTDVLTYAQRNQLFHNNGDGTFTEVSFESGPYFRREGVSRGAIFGDYDNDGDTDIVVAQSNQPAELLRNEGGNRRNWVRIKLVGTASNRDGIGARVTVTAGSESQMQEVRTGLSYLSSNDPRVLFGLGDNTRIDRLEIRWPSGIVQALENLEVNREIVVVEKGGE